MGFSVIRSETIVYGIGENRMSLNRRRFVRVVPALGLFSFATNRADAQQEQQAGPVWPAPPSTPAWRDESFPSQHPHLAREISASRIEISRASRSS